jgi:hypothetical protein
MDFRDSYTGRVTSDDKAIWRFERPILTKPLAFSSSHGFMTERVLSHESRALYHFFYLGEIFLSRYITCLLGVLFRKIDYESKAAYCAVTLLLSLTL